MRARDRVECVIQWVVRILKRLSLTLFLNSSAFRNRDSPTCIRFDLIHTNRILNPQRQVEHRLPNTIEKGRRDASSVVAGHRVGCGQ